MKKRDFFPVLVYIILSTPQNRREAVKKQFAAPDEDKRNAHSASTSGNFGN